jgi:hypothetical protein
VGPNLHKETGGDQVDKQDDQVDKQDDQVDKQDDQVDKQDDQVDKQDDQVEREDHVDKKNDAGEAGPRSGRGDSTLPARDQTPLLLRRLARKPEEPAS